MGEKEEKKKDIANDAQVEGRHAEIQAEIYQIDMDHAVKVLRMHEEELTKVQEVVEVVTTAKLITEVVTAASAPVSAASIIILAVEPNILAVTIIAAPVKVTATSTRRRRGVDIDWDVAIEHVKQNAKEDPFIQRYQVMKKRPQTEAQARRNMIMYLKNTAGFKALESINETSTQKVAKRRRLNQEDKDVEEIKQHLEIMPDEDDDVYTEATPLARKVPVMDYQIVLLNNKPQYKIIKADRTHQLYASFITVLKNFDRDDLETLWRIVKEWFSTSKLNKFSDEYLLTTLRIMFGRPALELMLLRSLKKNTKCVNAAGEELSVVKHKLMLLDTAAERS
nr:hypothetical protein [Tanacetum cinerariifolium]